MNATMNRDGGADHRNCFNDAFIVAARRSARVSRA